MAPQQNPKNTKKTSNNIPIEDLRSFVDDFPALLWRIEIARSRIEFLNDHPLPPLGDSARLFLKNKAFRKQMLLPEDAHLLDAFLDAVSQGKTMATVFRVHTPTDSIMWLKLTGAVNSSDPRYYYGYLLDVGDTVDVIRYIETNEAASRLRIDNVPTPVLLVNHHSLRLRQANAAARSLFGLARATKGRLPLFSEIFPKVNDATFEAILNDLPGQPWAGVLDFNTIQGEPFKAATYLKWFLWRQTAIIRISLSQNIDEKHNKHQETRNAETTFRNAPNLASILGQALEHPNINKCCNAIMLSDVHPRTNKVFVTGAGTPLADMPPCEEFSYRGTIAEDIDRFNLDHLIVDETMDSIKPIDWALFIPRGIRSYFAKPFYEGKTLRTVLILCSTEPNRFVGLKTDSFDSILCSLNKAARALRPECGKRNGS